MFMYEIYHISIDIGYITYMESFPIIKDYNKVEIADRLQTDVHFTLYTFV